MAQTHNEEWEKKILKQVEFYFSDSNFPKDKFLRAQAALDEQGFVQLSVICSFARMKQLDVSDLAKVAELLRKSPNLVVNEAGTMVKRSAPLSTDVSKLAERIVYTKGWPLEVGFEEIEKIMSAHGKVASVRVRKTPDKVSKGSAFVEFDTVEAAKELVSAGTVKAFERDITVVSKQQWYENKRNKRNKKKEEKDPSKKRKADGDWMEDTDGKKVKTEGSEAEKNAVNEGGLVKAEGKKEEDYELGCIVELKGLAKDTTRELIKQTFVKFGAVKFVEYHNGQEQAFVRMDDAKKAIEQIGANKLTIGTTPVDVRLLEGEEEKAYWVKVKSFSGNKKKPKKSKRGRRF